MKKKAVIFYSILIFTPLISFSQNTLSYTELSHLYNEGVELFEKKSYVAARKSFKGYIEKTQRTLSPNQFTLANASYYAAISGLYTNSLDADIEVERFVTNFSDHPKAKIIYSDLANSFYEDVDYPKAIEYFKKATAYRANTLEVYEDKFKWGVSYYKLSNFNEALIIFNEVKSTISEKAIHSAYYAAVINFKNENYDAALVDLKRVENVNPYKIEVPNWIAQIYFKQKKYEELINYAEPIISNPNGRKIDEVCLVAAEVLFFRDEYSKAAAYYDKFKQFRRGVTDAQVTFRHAYSLYKMEDFAKAAILFKQIANQKDPLGQQAAYYLGISSLKSKDLNSAAAAFNVAQTNNFDAAITEEATYNYTKVLVEQGNNAEAIDQLKKYVSAYPNGKYVDQSNEILSDILFENNSYKTAIEYIEGLPRKNNKINEAYQKLTYNQGVIEFNIEKFREAFTYFKKSISQPINVQLVEYAKFWLAESAFALGEKNTEQLYREALESKDLLTRYKSLYGLGYYYFESKDYTKAERFFKEFTDRTKGNEQFIQKNEDALMRLGDTYLVQRNFNKALETFDYAVNNNRTERDYALYQKAITLKFLGKNKEAGQALRLLTTQYQNSRLIDDALYQQGRLELEAQEYQLAAATFTELLRKRPNSTLVPSVLVRRALAFSNFNKTEQAINDYKVIIRRFGKSDEVEEALIGLRDLLSQANRNEEFMAIAEEYRKNNPESTSIVTIQYETAKGLYFNQKYEQAIQSLKSYISSYPSSSNVPEAKYYIADSYFILEDFANALNYYKNVVVDNQTQFVAQSAYRAGTILYDQKKYSEAVSFFVTSTEASSNKRQIALGLDGLIKTYFELGDCQNVNKYSKQVTLNGGNIIIGLENKAILFEGKCLQKSNEFQNAIIVFERVISMAKDANAAEAKYRIGEILFQQKKYEESITLLQNLSQNYGDFVEWYEKAFLLISRNYIAKNDVFMAKATLNSIIENSESKETVDEAKKILNTIN